MTKRGLKRGFWLTVAAFVALYLGDELVARIRPRSAIEVEVFYAITRKDNRIDYMKGDRQMEPCVRSALEHMGLRPCWYVERNPRMDVEAGIQKNDFWRH